LSRRVLNSSRAAESQPFVLRDLDGSAEPEVSRKPEEPFQPSVFDPDYSGPLPGLTPEPEPSIREAELTPEDVLAEARRQAEDIRRQARDEACQAGLAEGRAQGQREADRLAADLGRLIESLAAERRRLFQAAERDLIDLVISFGRRIVGAELASRPETVRRAVRQAVDALLATEALKIRLHPEDAPLVEPIVEQLSRAAGGAGVELKPDPSLTRGGALIETETQEVDARLETRLDEIGRNLVDELVRSQGAAATPPPEPPETVAEDEAASAPDKDLPDLEWGDPVPVDKVNGQDKDTW
jgi:flagellar assembly protein FliH